MQIDAVSVKNRSVYSPEQRREPLLKHAASDLQALSRMAVIGSAWGNLGVRLPLLLIYSKEILLKSLSTWAVLLHSPSAPVIDLPFLCKYRAAM